MCNKLHELFNKQTVFSFPFDESKIPLNGIYILFENGEVGHGFRRIVRVGTHTGNDQLRSRIRQHFLNENKDRSIFRKNIGRAILNKNDDPYLKTWELDMTSRENRESYGSLIDKEYQAVIESKITQYLQDNFCFIVIRVDDKKERLALESKIISTISSCNECRPSPNWLGNYSPKIKIRESGLWLVNELYKEELNQDDYIRLIELLK